MCTILYLLLSSSLPVLQPDSGWEVDLPHLKSLIDDRTMAIVLSNPSFPTGTVYSKSHLKEVLEVAEHHLVPVISDECEAASIGLVVQYSDLVHRARMRRLHRVWNTFWVGCSHRCQ